MSKKGHILFKRVFYDEELNHYQFSLRKIKSLNLKCRRRQGDLPFFVQLIFLINSANETEKLTNYFSKHLFIIKILQDLTANGQLTQSHFLWV